MTITLLLTGIALLLLGGAALVRGASALAELYGISPLIVGLTVVAFGTSAPELVVNTLGALRGETALAFGNIAGSNIANLGLVLGSAALLTPVVLGGQIIRRELPLFLLATAVLVVMAFDPLFSGEPAQLDRSDAVIMLLLFSIFIYITAVDFLRQREDALLQEVNALPLSPSRGKSTHGGLLAAGAIGLTLGAHLTITYGSALAHQTGVSPAIIGLVVVAIGTSLPELVTSLIAAAKKQADLCVGNVVGSNLFNTMFVLPISALIHPIDVPRGGVLDLTMVLILAASLVPIFIFGHSAMSRVVGVAFLAIYSGYMLFRVLH